MKEGHEIICLKKRATGRAINKYPTDNSNLIKKIRNIFMYERVLISREGLKGQISIFIKGEKCQELHLSLFLILLLTKKTWFLLLFSYCTCLLGFLPGLYD